jgi:hypothetical protein
MDQFKEQQSSHNESLLDEIYVQLSFLNHTLTRVSSFDADLICRRIY